MIQKENLCHEIRKMIIIIWQDVGITKEQTQMEIGKNWKYMVYLISCANIKKNNKKRKNLRENWENKIDYKRSRKTINWNRENINLETMKQLKEFKKYNRISGRYK